MPISITIASIVLFSEPDVLCSVELDRSVGSNVRSKGIKLFCDTILVVALVLGTSSGLSLGVGRVRAALSYLGEGSTIIVSLCFSIVVSKERRGGSVSQSLTRSSTSKEIISSADITLGVATDCLSLGLYRWVISNTISLVEITVLRLGT